MAVVLDPTEETVMVTVEAGWIRVVVTGMVTEAVLVLVAQIVSMLRFSVSNEVGSVE